MVPSPITIESAALRDSYADTGLHLWEGLFSAQDLAGLATAIDSLRLFPSAHHACASTLHLAPGDLDAATRMKLRRLAGDARLVQPAMQVLGSEVYVHSFALSIKPPFVGGGSPWHQDYLSWTRLHAMPRPDAVSVAVFMDDVTQFNGPMFCIPGAHRSGLYPCQAETLPMMADAPLPAAAGLADDPGRMLRQDVVAALVEDWGLFSALAQRGSAFFFHPLLPYASGVNISPHRCCQVIITYNSVENRWPLPPGRLPRSWRGGRSLAAHAAAAEVQARKLMAA